MKGKKPNGGPHVLTKGEIETIRKEILNLHSKEHYPTYDKIWDFVYLHFKKYLHIDILRNYFQENLTDSFKSCLGVAMNELRLGASEEEIDQYYEDLEAEAEGITLQFIFILDECGMQDWMDAREQRVYLPKDYNK